MANDPKDPKNPNVSDAREQLNIENNLSKLLLSKEQRLKTISETLKEQQEISEQLIDLAAKGGDEDENHLEVTERLIENEKKRVKNLLEELKLKKELKQITQEQYELEKKELELLKQENKELDKKNKVEKDFANSLSNGFTSMTGIGAQSKTVLGSMAQMAGKGGDLGEALGAAAKNISKIVTFGNVVAVLIDGIVGQTKKLFFEMDVSFAKFEKTAGGVDAFKGRIVELRDKNVEYALSIEEASAAFSDLKTQFSGFAGVSVATQDALAKTTAQMSKLGVSSSETIKIQNMLVKGFQMTGEQAGDMQKQLMATAKSMGLPMQKVVSDFANAAPNIKAHGANMQKVFLDLQNQAKNTGIEFSKLQAITGKFDTFEGAADAAGNLNAILGGDYLNSIQLLNADEGERVRLMQDALKASGKSFEAMSKQERMAAAAALGLEDATELQKLMNNETEAGTVEALNKAEAEKELAKSVQDVTTMQEKLTAIMAQFAIVLNPVLDVIKLVLTEFGKLMSTSPLIKYGVLGVIGVIILLFAVLKGASIIGGFVSGFTSIKDTLKGVQKPAQDAGSGIASSIRRIGQAATQSRRGLLALGAAILMIGAGIGVAALGLAQLVQAFQGLTGPQMIGAILGLIVVMLGFIAIIVILGAVMLAGPGAAAAAGMLALGAAFLMIGIGIGIAALGLAQLVKSFGGLGDAALPAAAAVVALSVSMYLIVAALAAAIPVILAAGSAFALAAPGLLAFGAAIALIGVGVAVAAVGISVLAKSVGDMFEKISKSNPENISGAFAAIFDNLSLTNIAKFAAFAEQTDELTSSLNKLVFSLTAVSTAMKTISAVNALFNPSTVTAPNVAPTAGTTATAAAATNNAGSSNIVPVAIYIDSKKVGEVLDPRYKKMIESSLNNIGGRTVPI